MTIAVLLIGLVCGGLVGYLLARLRHADPAADAAELARTREELAGARALVEQLRAQNADLTDRAAGDQDVLRALAPVQQTLHEVGQHVITGERQRAAQYAALAEQLRVTQASEERLRTTTDQLAGALRTTSTRGQWGEVQLRRVLEASGMLRHVDFVEQESLQATGLRPDVVIHLPQGRLIAIDAKVPLSAFLQACEIPDHADGAEGRHREQLLAQHAKALRAHVDTLATRQYWTGLPASPELTIMFLPAESLLGAALDADPGLMEYALSRSIAPAGPSTLLSLLKTVAVIWQQSSVTEDARALLDLGQTLYQRLGTLAEHAGKLGSALQGSVTAYNRMVASLESRVLVTARNLDAFDASRLAVSPIESERGQLRTMTAPELSGDLPLGTDSVSAHGTAEHWGGQ